LSTTSASFSADPEGTSERQLAAPLLGYRPIPSSRGQLLSRCREEVTFETTNPRRSGKSFGPCLNDEGETECTGLVSGATLQSFSSRAGEGGGHPASWTLCRSEFCARSRARRTFDRTATEALRRGIPRTLSLLWAGRRVENKPGTGMSPRITLDSKQVIKQVTLLSLPPHGS